MAEEQTKLDWGWLKRLPFTLLAAQGLLSLAQGAIEWQTQLGAWFEAWRALVMPVGQFLFGWAFALFGAQVPEWFADYVVMGLIVGGAFGRVMTVAAMDSGPDVYVPALMAVAVIGPLMAAPIWPLLLVSFAFSPLTGRLNDVYEEVTGRRYPLRRIFFECFAWAAMVVVINYALLAGGA